MVNLLKQKNQINGFFSLITSYISFVVGVSFLVIILFFVTVFVIFLLGVFIIVTFFAYVKHSHYFYLILVARMIHESDKNSGQQGKNVRL